MAYTPVFFFFLLGEDPPTFILLPTPMARLKRSIMIMIYDTQEAERNRSMSSTAQIHCVHFNPSFQLRHRHSLILIMHQLGVPIKPFCRHCKIMTTMKSCELLTSGFLNRRGAGRREKCLAHANFK